MATLTMTAAETAAYDSGDAIRQDALMRDLRARAKSLAVDFGEDTTIETTDGIVVAVVEGER